MKLPTLKDIANEAGLSNCVVSHVLHNDAYAAKVRPETRQRILEIARKLGYVQNQLASATRTGQVNTIALIVNFTKLQNPAPVSQIISGVMMESSARYYSIKIFSEDELELAFRQIAENRIDKVISMSVDHDLREHTAELADKYSMHLVFAYERGQGKFPAVNTDNVEVTASAVRYLAKHGHSRIGLLSAPRRWFFIEDRHNGYLQGMAQCGLEIDPRWIFVTDDIEQPVARILSVPKKERPTAFVALSDPVAMKAQRQAWKLKLRIPEDFSVVGVGDLEASRLAMVPITTFRENLFETGKLLVRLVLGEQVNIPPDEHNVYRTHAELIERESVCDLANRKIQATSHKSQVTR